MQSRLREIWSTESSRRKLLAALRAWNRALESGSEAMRRTAAGLLQGLYDYTAGTAEAGPGEDAQRCREEARTRTPKDAFARTQAETPAQTIERLLDFPSRRLAVYGSLAPGKENHHMMAGMQGTWRKAVLRGSLRNEGWGAGRGFPGFSWDRSKAPVAAQVFSSEDLRDHWRRLDEFEGPEYRRILVPVEIEGGEVEVCNVYSLAVNPHRG